MRSIQNAVERILVRDSDIKEKMAQRMINLSSYAKSIKSEVEDRTMKPTSVDSIVTALSRIMRSLSKGSKNKLPLSITQMIVHSPIVELVYSKTPGTIISFSKTIKKLGDMSSDIFFTLSTSTRDISIILSGSVERSIKDMFDIKPRIIKNDLIAISIRFDESKVSQPNVGAQFMKAVGMRGVVLDEVVSTYNEFTIVCNKKYFEDAVDVFNSFQGK